MSVCVRCWTWEEDLYWKHFSSMHFFLFLPRDFHQHLVLPAKFADNMMRKLPDKVSLIDPSATVWDIELKKTDNIEFGGDGWIQFVKAHNLKEKHLLVFKYKKNLSFEVLIFDLESFCEKESSYFVKQYLHGKTEYENEKKRTITEALSMEIIEDENNDDDHHSYSDFVVSKKLKNCIAEEPEKRKSPRPTRKSNARVPQGRTRPKRMLRSCESKSKSKALSEKELNGAEDGAAENELPEKRAARKLSDVSEREQNALENEAMHEVVEKEPQDNGATRKLSRVSERDVHTLGNGGSILETAHSHKSTTRKSRAKKRKASKSSKKLEYHSSEREQVEKGLVHDIVEEETEENGAAKEPVDVSEIEQNTPEDGRDALEATRSQKSTERTGRLKKRVPCKSSRKLVSQIGSSAEKYSSHYKSNRRAVTDVEKEMAMKMALQRMTDNSFVAVMRPSAVYQRFYLNVPSVWKNKHLCQRNQQVLLRMGEKTWDALFYFNGRKGGGISGYGWKKFVVDNYLEEFDVCIVTMATEKDDLPVIMDVEIFRVLPEIVPPSPVSHSKIA